MNILESYLVSLGFEVDEPSFHKLRNVLDDSERAVVEHASGMTRSLLEAQGAIVGTFTSISAAIIGVVDKSAMADQAWRLQGLHMLATTEQARKLDIITKSLGASLAEIVWDPELHARALVMSQDIDRWTKALGPDFEKSMRGVRDFRMELSRLEVAAEFLGMKFASDVFKKLFPNQDALKTLDKWVTDFGDKIPEMSDKLSNYAVPILKETWVIFQELGAVVKEAGVAFTNVVGVFSGDSSIEGTTFNFDKFAVAISHVAHGFEELLHWIANAEKSLVHFASAMALALGRKFSQTVQEFKSGLKQLTESSAAAMGVIVPGSPKDYARNSELGSTPQPSSPAVESEQQKPAESPYKTGQQQIRDWWNPSGLTAPDKKREWFPALQDPATMKALPPQPGETYQTGWQDLMDWFELHKQSKLQFDLNRAEQSARGTQAGDFVSRLPIAPIEQPQRASSRTDDTLLRLSREMAKLEGFGVPGAIPTVNNNPGDIILGKFATREGGIGQAKGYEVFPDIATGFKAMMDLIETKIEKGASLTDLIAGNKLKGIRGWNPADAPGNTKESTQRYIDKLAKRLNIDPSIPLKAMQGDWLAGHRGYDSPDIVPPKAPDIVPPKAKLESWAVPETRDWRPQMQLIADAQRPAVPAVSNSSNVQQSISLGGISVYITQPGANENQIRRAIAEALKETFDSRSQVTLAQLSPQWS